MAILNKRTMVITQIYAPRHKGYDETRDGEPRVMMLGQAGFVDIPLTLDAARKLKVGQELRVTIES